MSRGLNREIHLAAHPQGWPTHDTFALVETPIPEPPDGQVLVRNVFMSVDPYMRGRMNAARSYAPPYEVGQVLYAGAVGQVVASRTPAFAVGDIVLPNNGWLGRDPEPTPMQWAPGPNAGCTTGTPWLPLADDFDPARPRRRGGRRHAGVATR